MPELPEVETIASDLSKKINDLVIIDFKVLNEKSARLRALLNFNEKQFRQKLLNQRVLKVERKAKQIVMELDHGYLLIHLKMTGQLVLETCRMTGCNLVVGGHPIVGIGRELPNKFTRACFWFNDGSRLYFNDVRRFGWLKFLNNGEFDEFVSQLGVEPLSKEFTLKLFKEILSKRQNVTIKQAILEQKHLVGVGNIYADEALFEAGIKPMRLVKSLAESEIKKLWLSIPKVFRLAIKHRGTSFSDYRDANGEQGNFIKYLKVYGRTGLPCKKCQGLVQKTKIAGRGTHWCEICQK